MWAIHRKIYAGQSDKVLRCIEIYSKKITFLIVPKYFVYIIFIYKCWKISEFPQVIFCHIVYQRAHLKHIFSPASLE